MMARHHFRPGELAQWLEKIASQEAAAQVPPDAIEALIVLRCVTRATDGTLSITEKGKLALHMEAAKQQGV